jgi:hypothetical protein
LPVIVVPDIPSLAGVGATHLPPQNIRHFVLSATNVMTRTISDYRVIFRATGED